MSRSKRARRHWRERRKAAVRPGTAPGQLVVDPRAVRSTLRVMAYGPDRFIEPEVHDLQELGELARRWPTLWVDVTGIDDVATITALGELFGLHRLALEDVAHLGQRAKADLYDEYLFVVARMTRPGAEAHASEQLSLFLGSSFVITFQEEAGDPFEGVRSRIRAGKGRIRAGGADYLAYALIDATIDLQFPLLDGLGERLETLEREVVSDCDERTLARLQQIRSELLATRRDLLPHRDLIQTLARTELPQISPATRLYLRDCHDHVCQQIDLLEVYRELSSDLMHAYLSSVSNRMNEVMKVLTIIATIFMPLSFVAGVYGMNFDPGASPWNMPELRWRWGYPVALGVMGAAAVAMLLYFRRLGWFGDKRSRP